MPGEWLNNLTYDNAMYTRANVEKTANSQVRLDAHIQSDYTSQLLRLRLVLSKYSTWTTTTCSCTSTKTK